MIRLRRVLLLALIICVGCLVHAIRGPESVLIGQVVQYDIDETAEATGTNATAYVIMDVPLGWTVLSATYDATINGSPQSGTAQQVPYTSTSCPGGTPPTGYQRLAFAATFASVTDDDSGTLHLRFRIGGVPGSYSLRAYGGGTSSAGTNCSSAGLNGFLNVVVGAAIVRIPIPTLGEWALIALAALLALIAVRRL